MPTVLQTNRVTSGERRKQTAGKQGFSYWLLAGSEYRNGHRVPALRKHSAHLHTHLVFPASGNHLDVPFPSFRFPFRSPEPQYPPPDHPGGAGSKTIGRKPITHTKPLRSLSFYVCCVPPTYDTHTCFRFPLLLSRLPCIKYTGLRLRLFDYPFSDSWCTNLWNPAPDFLEFTLFRFDGITITRQTTVRTPRSRTPERRSRPEP